MLIAIQKYAFLLFFSIFASNFAQKFYKLFFMQFDEEISGSLRSDDAALLPCARTRG
jgi:hypothetical protein